MIGVRPRESGETPIGAFLAHGWARGSISDRPPFCSLEGVTLAMEAGSSTARALAPEMSATPVHPLGENVFDVIAEIGDVAAFSVSTLVWIVRRRPRWSVLVPIFYAIGVKSVSVVAITGTFIGMVLAVQAYHQFAMMGLATRLGSVINISIVRELGPVLAATMLAGRVGSSMAAELGTMRASPEQIDALSALGTNPIYYLVVPRFLACVLLIPLLTLMGDFMGVIGGAVVSTQILKIDSFAYWKLSLATSSIAWTSSRECSRAISLARRLL